MKTLYTSYASQSAITFCRCLIVLLAVGLSACQRSTYLFQRVAELEQPSVVANSTANMTNALVTAPAQEPTSVGSSIAQPQHKAKHRLRPLAAPVHKVRSLLALRAAVHAVHPRTAAQPKEEPLPPGAPANGRSRGIAFLLAFLLGATGAHLFYLGYHGRGLTYLLLTAAAIVLLSIGAVGFVAALFGGGDNFLVLLLFGSILASVVSALALIDAVFILTNSLRPRNGEYYPRFFQTRP